MQLNKHKKIEFIEKAVSSKNLTARADSNRLYARADFNLWIANLLSKLHFSLVLDVCCGTGNQLVQYASRPRVEQIVGVDISEKSLSIARERLGKMHASCHIVLKKIEMEKMFKDAELKNLHFDLISCFYGLYYSKGYKKILAEMVEHLSEKGVLLIVGPYGKNNTSLFDLLTQYFELPELVTRSSTTFMEEEVRPLLENKCEIEEESFVNPIYYPSACSLLDYWRSSTFYFPEYENAVATDIENYFSKHNEFIVEKHVKAYIGRKRA